MLKFFNFIRFQYLFWKLHSRFFEEGEWIINQESIMLFKRCFQLIDQSHFKRLNRKYLQNISVISYTGGLVEWLRKCEEAKDNLITMGEFPPSWGFLIVEREMTLSEYLSSDDYWREPREVIIEIFHHLEELERLVREGGDVYAGYRFRKMKKLFSEAIHYLAILLLLYKENQYVSKKRREGSRTP